MMEWDWLAGYSGVAVASAVASGVGDAEGVALGSGVAVAVGSGVEVAECGSAAGGWAS